jgi:hypothetical protein
MDHCATSCLPTACQPFAHKLDKLLDGEAMGEQHGHGRIKFSEVSACSVDQAGALPVLDKA